MAEGSNLKYQNLKYVSTRMKVFYAQTGKTTAIRRAAVREAGVSRHHVGPQLEALLKPLQHHGTNGTEGFKGGPQLRTHSA